LSCIYNLEIVDKLKIGNPQERHIKNVIDNVRSGETLSLTGGEPTIRKEFFKFLKYAKEKDPYMSIFIVSNGRMFYYREFVEKMVSIGLENLKVGIAIYGHNSELHDATTRISGSFEQTIQGIRNLIESNIPVELRIIVNKLNYIYLEDIARYITEDLKGVFRVVFINMKYTGNAYINRNALFVRYKDVVPYTEKAAGILLENGIEVKLFHFPLCIIDKRYWDLAKGVTKQESELMFVEACNECKMKKECPRIWKSYWILAGNKEFNAIINPY
jgi:His-Xaa-Ser system radical SAM maturase HxsC